MLLPLEKSFLRDRRADDKLDPGGRNTFKHCHVQIKLLSAFTVLWLGITVINPSVYAQNSTWKTVGEWIKKGSDQERLGEELDSADLFHEALGHYRQALQAYQLEENFEGQAETLLRIAHVSVQLLENLEDSKVKTGQAFDIFQKSGSVEGPVRALLVESEVLSAMNWRDEAFSTLQRALTIAKKVRVSLEVEVLIRLGTHFDREGRLEEAESTFRDAAERASHAGESAAAKEAQALIGLGRVFRALGRPKNDSSQCFSRAREIFRKAQDLHGEIDALLRLGGEWNSQKEWGQALGFHQEALRLSESGGDFFRQHFDSLMAVGKCFFCLERDKEARFYFEKAFELAKKRTDAIGLANALCYLALIDDSTGRFADLRSSYKRGIEVTKLGTFSGNSFAAKFHHAWKRSDAEAMGQLVQNAGPIVFNYVLERTLRMLEMAEERPNEPFDLAFESKMAEVYAQQYGNGNLPKLVGAYANLAPAQRTKLLLGRKRLQEGHLDLLNGKMSESRARLEEAEKFFQELTETPSEATACEYLAEVVCFLDGVPSAIGYLEKALDLHRRIGNPFGQGVTLSRLGGLHRSRGQFGKALDELQEAQRFFADQRLPEKEAAVLVEISRLYQTFGWTAEALENAGTALRFQSFFFDDLSSPLSDIGNLFFQAGQWDEAELYFRLVGKIQMTQQGRTLGAWATGRRGDVCLVKQEFAQAIELYQIALATMRQIGNIEGQADSLDSLGLAQIETGNPTEAVKTLTEGLTLFERTGNRLDLPYRLRHLGLALWRSGESERAAETYARATDVIENLFRQTGSFREEARLSFFEKRSVIFREYLELLLDLHARFPNKGYDRKAFTLSERSKSLLFREQMSSAGAKIGLAGDKDFQVVMEQERLLRERSVFLINSLSTELRKPETAQDKDFLVDIERRLNENDNALRRQVEETARRFPRFEEMKNPHPMEVKELQSLLAPGEVMVSYSLAGSKTVAFVIGKTSFRTLILNLSQEKVRKLVRSFRVGLDDIKSTVDLERFRPEKAVELYRAVWAPLVQFLGTNERVYISADDVLYLVPFEALVDRPYDQPAFRQARMKSRKGEADFLSEYQTLHFLADSKVIIYLPAAGVLRMLRKMEKPRTRSWTKPLVAFADPVFSNEGTPVSGVATRGVNQETALTLNILKRATGEDSLIPLPESRQEAQAVSAELGAVASDIYLGERATEENVFTRDLSRARFILFSTHGLLGGDFAGVAEPSLALSLVGNPEGRDGFLGMSEVLGLDLNAEMAVLSACNTAGQSERTGAGEGFAGLTRSFMYAGCRSILVTHWSVDTQAARDLIIETFHRMKTSPRPLALHAAKLAIKASVIGNGAQRMSRAHPFFWAAFVLVGDGRL